MHKLDSGENYMAGEDVTVNGHVTHRDSLKIDQLVGVAAVVAD